jgi:purine-binding chemotaxis protein CheW
VTADARPIVDRSSSVVCVVCRAGTVVCALPVEHVSEMMRPLPVEALAGMPSFVSGVALVRGVPTPVVESTRMLGLAGPPQTTRFVALRIGARQAVMAVDAVLGVSTLSRESLGELPPLLRGASSEVVDGIGRLDAGLLVLLSSAKIVPAAVWALLDAAGSPP